MLVDIVDVPWGFSGDLRLLTEASIPVAYICIQEQSMLELFILLVAWT